MATAPRTSTAALCSRAHKAAGTGDVEALEALIQEVPSALEMRDYWQKTPLHTAANVGNEESVQYLLEAGAKIDPQDKDGFTPLHLATSKGRLRVVTVLLDAGASIKLLNGQGDNVLHIAAMNAEAEVIEQLLARGAQSTFENLNGFLPEELAPDDTAKAMLTKSHPTKFVRQKVTPNPPPPVEEPAAGAVASSAGGTSGVSPIGGLPPLSPTTRSSLNRKGGMDAARLASLMSQKMLKPEEAAALREAMLAAKNDVDVDRELQSATSHGRTPSSKRGSRGSEASVGSGFGSLSSFIGKRASGVFGGSPFGRGGAGGGDGNSPGIVAPPSPAYTMAELFQQAQEEKLKIEAARAEGKDFGAGRERVKVMTPDGEVEVIM